MLDYFMRGSDHNNLSNNYCLLAEQLIDKSLTLSYKCNCTWKMCEKKELFIEYCTLTLFYELSKFLVKIYKKWEKKNN